MKEDQTWNGSLGWMNTKDSLKNKGEFIMWTFRAPHEPMEGCSAEQEYYGSRHRSELGCISEGGRIQLLESIMAQHVAKAQTPIYTQAENSSTIQRGYEQIPQVQSWKDIHEKTSIRWNHQ